MKIKNKISLIFKLFLQRIIQKEELHKKFFTPLGPINSSQILSQSLKNNKTNPLFLKKSPKNQFRYPISI